MKTSSVVTADFSVRRPTKKLMDEIRKTLTRIQGYGSVEIIIQNHHVVQITERHIKKVNNINNGSDNTRIISGRP